jgi:toxin-antitoxin system PIN domain toxin
MIAVDTNILVYAHRGESPFHERSKAALDELAASGRPWGTVWQCVHEFAAIVTHPKIFRPPSTMEECVSEIENWRSCPTFRCIAEGPSHWLTLHRVLRKGRIQGPMVHDARIAAVCLAHGVEELWSVDRDFSRFPELKVINPLGA